jgi:uncharacterized repeat protein (TIGR03803 family)
MNQLVQGLVAAVALAALSPGSQGASSETVLFNFGLSTNKAVGSLPYSPVIFDAKGNLYGTTSSGGKYGNGTVFKLTPPTAGGTAWTQTLLYSFNIKANGSYPTSGLVMDAAGDLYGTTQDGGTYGFGTAFKLTPPNSGTTWTETTIAVFNGNNGQSPTNAAMILDSKGNLYGTTDGGGASGQGTVFELTPPGSGSLWAHTVLCSFKGSNGGNPAARLTFDHSGNLYGTAQSGGGVNAFGVVFKLTKPAPGKTTWTESVIATFTGAGGNGGNPMAGVVFDNAGNLYGTTVYGGGAPNPNLSGGLGVVYKLAPPTATTHSWTPSILLNLGGSYGENPSSDPVFDKQGNLYITTAGGGASNGGTVVKLTRPASASGSWTPTLLYSFAYAKGENPAAGMIFDSKFSALYGTTCCGGKNEEGVVYKLTP